MAEKLDLRVNAYRPDLAAVSLRSRYQAGRYVKPQIYRCTAGRLPVYAARDLSGRMISELRYGEFADVYETTDGVTWLQNRTDQYVGYASAEGLSELVANPSHQINVLRTFLYSEADIKSPPLDGLMLGSMVDVVEQAGQGGDAMARLGPGGWVCMKHLAAIGPLEADYVTTAGRLLGAPYLWGGRSPLGVDCSGLVQFALNLADLECPRDSDMQEAAFGRPLEGDWQAHDYRRGDIVFFKGHVGIMTTASHIIHANAHHMQVAVEPLAELVARGVAVTSVGRP